VTDLPEWGREVIGESRTESVAGQAANMAFAISAMGIYADVVGAVGDDAGGVRIRNELFASGVGIDGIAEIAGGTTPLTLALVRPDGERAFVSDLGSLPGFNVAAMAIQRVSVRPSSVVALVGTANVHNVDVDATVELFRMARNYGALTVFDPGWDPLGWGPKTLSFVHAILAETDVFLPNREEAEALTGEHELFQIFDAMNELGSATTVVKGGMSGSYVTDGKQLINVHAIPTLVDNAVGAGDVFNSGVIAAYLYGYEFLASLKLASAASSLYVGRRDNRYPNIQECATLADDVEVEVVKR
jgi:ribokinase